MAHVEIVPLKQFTRGGKANMYLNYGVVQLFDILEDSKEQQLNFTHSTLHGSDADISSDYGSLQNLADSQLDLLKTKYPEVFSTPAYPVDRTQCGKVFEHTIPLVDENASPLKRKLYPLDS